MASDQDSPSLRLMIPNCDRVAYWSNLRGLEL